MRSLVISTCLLITGVMLMLICVTEAKNLPFSELVSSYCPQNRTECAFGCCPYDNGTCCSNGYHCCREEEVCGVESGQCLGLDHDGRITPRLASPLYFPASTAEEPTACPPCTTRCGEDKCCPFRDGTCCSDGLHCCPYRYACDLTEQNCHYTVMNEVTSRLEGGSGLNTTLPVVTMQQALDNEEYIICPGGARCPTKYAQCCEEPDYGFLTCCYLLGQTRSPVHPLMSDNDVCP